MISKIKSKKIANIKILVGIVLAASLIIVFACEQKESVKTDISPAPNSVTIVADGKSLQVTGDAAGIEKLKSAISGSEEYELKSDSATGQLLLVNKTNKVGEVVAVAYGSQEKTEAFQQEIYTVVEQMPEFPGGDLELRNYIAKSIHYPKDATKRGIQGKVFVSFVVNKDGSVGTIKITKGVNPILDEEAYFVISKMPKWKPGKRGGKEVAVQYTIPIKFVLQ